MITKTIKPEIQIYQLSDFWDTPQLQRDAIIVDAIQRSHTWHFKRNYAYRQAVAARGVGEAASFEDFPRLLRQTSQTFKSYIDLLGTPFPQDNPQAFLKWLANQLSIELPLDRLHRFQSRYRSLEGLLQDIERIYADFGLELLTSSGTSGRSTIMVRDQEGIDKTVESFYLAFQRYLGMQADHRVIFIMPRQTRIAMVRMASFSFTRVGLPEERVHFTIPFPAYPDQVRIRTGKIFRAGVAGWFEHRVLHPFMNWMDEHYVTPKTIRQTIELLEAAEGAQEKVLLFGGWVQLHVIAQELAERGKHIHLAQGSLLGTGGGMKAFYPFTPKQIQVQLAQVITLSTGDPIPFHDVYGMAEGNWAAMQCRTGNYHIPPWVYSAIVDENNQIQQDSDHTGLLAFFDPLGGGQLFPSFFKTADRVRLVNGSSAYDPVLNCPCGEQGAYIVKDSIQRVDLLDEAGCAAQI